MTAPTMAIAIIIATAASVMYIPVGGCAAIGWGDAVTAGWSTVKCDSVDDG
jgi:hypothetical protein